MANALPGTRAIEVFKAAFKLGGLVGADVLDERVAEHALRDAARVHDGIDRWTPVETNRHIHNGIARGRQHPRVVDLRTPTEARTQELDDSAAAVNRASRAAQ